MMTIEEALTAVRSARRDQDVVVTTMAPAKVWVDMAGGPAGLHPRDLVFVPSCMGHATSVGLGIALAQPRRRVIVCNGDGSMLMNLGSLVTIASQAPRNLVVIVFDNGVYEVTGAQPVPARVDYEALARGAGFTMTHRFAKAVEWAANVDQVVAVRGPVLVVLDIKADAARPAPKSPGPAPARGDALRKALASGMTAAMLLLSAFTLPAQSRGGTISGTVTDSAKRGIADAEVVLRPLGRRTRTDSAGQFLLTNIDNGAYAIVARKLGYAPETHDVSLRAGGAVSLRIVLMRQTVLDTVRVTARGGCPVYQLDAFFCRQRFGGGRFLDFADIDEFGERTTGDVFRHIPGFRVSLQRTVDGWTPSPQRVPRRCVMYLLNGKASSWGRMPRYTHEVSAIEVYLKPDTVPLEIMREMRLAAGAGTDLHLCDAVVIWTVDAPV